MDEWVFFIVWVLLEEIELFCDGFIVMLDGLVFVFDNENVGLVVIYWWEVGGEI